MNIDINKLDNEIAEATKELSKQRNNIGYINDNPIARSAALGKVEALKSIRKCLVSSEAKG